MEEGVCVRCGATVTPSTSYIEEDGEVCRECLEKGAQQQKEQDRKFRIKVALILGAAMFGLMLLRELIRAGVFSP
jgi:recombinational DNA repair protein (RecF pathway)